MEGLLGALAAGALGGAGAGMSQNARVVIDMALQNIREQNRMDFEERVYARGRKDKEGERALDKDDAIKAENRRLANEKGLIEARGKEDRKTASVKDKSQDPSKAEREKLLLEEARLKMGKEKRADEITAAEAAVDFNKYENPSDRATAQAYLTEQKQGLLGRPKPETEKVTTKETTNVGEITVEGTRPVASKPTAKTGDLRNILFGETSTPESAPQFAPQAAPARPVDVIDKEINAIKAKHPGVSMDVMVNNDPKVAALVKERAEALKAGMQ